MVGDKRKAKRRSVRYSAWLRLADGAQAACVLSDISETGARIMVDDSALVPDKFVLILSANGAARRSCAVVWRRQQQIGVKFEQSLGAQTAAPAPARPGSAALPENEPAESGAVERVSLPA